MLTPNAHPSVARVFVRVGCMAMLGLCLSNGAIDHAGDFRQARFLTRDAEVRRKPPCHRRILAPSSFRPRDTRERDPQSGAQAEAHIVWAWMNMPRSPQAFYGARHIAALQEGQAEFGERLVQ